MLYLHAVGEVVTDAHAQTGIVLSDELLDVSQAVVAAVGAVGLQAELPKGDCHFVGDDEQAFLVDILLAQPVADSIAAEVHEGGGLEQEYLPSFQGCLCQKAVALVGENNIGRLCEGVQYHVSSIVAGIGIFITGVSQSHNQVFVHNQSGLFSGSLSSSGRARSTCSLH